MESDFKIDVTVLGGCGRVGLPLALAFSDRGLRVGIYDISAESVERVSRGEMPFREQGAEEILRARVADGSLRATVAPSLIAESEVVVVVIGTPVDEHMNPDPDSVTKALLACEQHIRFGRARARDRPVSSGPAASTSAGRGASSWSARGSTRRR